MFEKIEELERRYEEIQAELSAPEVVNDQARFRKLMKEQTDMGSIVNKYREYKEVKKTIDESLELLDSENDPEMRELIKRLNEEKNMTIMISSHILGELQKVATVFGIISEGKLVTEVTAEELKNSYIGEADSLEEFYLDIIRKGQKAC